MPQRSLTAHSTHSLILQYLASNSPIFFLMATVSHQAMQILPLLLIILPLFVSSRTHTVNNINHNDNLIQKLNDLSSSSPFPPNFIFGTSSSAYQFEGAYLSDGRSLSNWDVYSHTPGNIADGSSGDVAVDQYHRYEEDVELLASLGINGHKISISWSRVLPKGRHGSINWQGINYYKKLINALLSKGIEPFVTINHYDLPQEFEERHRGWLGVEMVEEYVYFANVCFENLGERVKYWVTFNEPNQWAILSYQQGVWPPNRCLEACGNCTQGGDERETFMAAHNIILAHASAVNIYRKNYQKKQGGQIGIGIDFFWYEPISNSTADKAAAERAHAFMNHWFLNPIMQGTYPKEMKDILGTLLPEFSSSDLEILKDGLDFIGINHYTTFYVKDCLFSKCEPSTRGNNILEGFVGKSLEKNGVLIGELTGIPDMSIYPPAMEKLVTYMTERFPKMPLFITENGYCDLTDSNSSVDEVMNDTKRVKYLTAYLDALGNAIRKGADVRGYLLWSLLDNFEWTYGYSRRMGLYNVDRVTLKRSPKLSASWYKQFIAENKRVGSKMQTWNQ